jgi:hypothetical protein
MMSDEESLIRHKELRSSMSNEISTGLCPARSVVIDVNQLMDPFFFRRLYI